MGRQKGWKPFSPPKNNLIQDSQGNDENGYPVLDSNKTKKMTARNPMMPTRTSSKKKSCK
jgi:hypothetical protein